MHASQFVHNIVFEFLNSFVEMIHFTVFRITAWNIAFKDDEVPLKITAWNIVFKDDEVPLTIVIFSFHIYQRIANGVF